MSPLTVYRADGTPKTSAPSSLSIPLDPWHNIGAAGEPGFQNGWAVYPGHTPPAFRRMPDGTVQLRGMLRNGTMATAMFTLPIGYRPKTYVNVMSSASYSAPNYTPGYIQIYPDGTVLSNTGSNSQQSIDSIFFDTELITAMPTGPPGPQGATGPQGGNSVILLDQWHTVGAVGEPPLLNGWLAIGAGYEAQFRKDPMGRVFLRGALGAGLTGQSAFQLPAGYRPLKPVEFPQSVNATFGRSYVDTSGNVLLFGNTNHWLTTIQFDTDTVTQMPSGPKGDTGAVGGNATVAMDAVHYVGGSGEPAFTGSWVNYDNSAAAPGTSAQRSARFRKFPDGRVRIAGTIKTGASGASVFTLPVGYRPPNSSVTFACQASGGGIYLTVNPDGTVQPFNLTGTNVSAYTFLDGIEFDTEAVTQVTVGPKGDTGAPGGTMGASYAAFQATKSVLSTSGVVDIDGWTRQEYLDDTAYSISGRLIVVRDAGVYDIHVSAIGNVGASRTYFNLLSGGVGTYFNALGPVPGGPSGTISITKQLAAGGSFLVQAYQEGTGGNVTVNCQISRVGGPQGIQGPPGNSATVPMDTLHKVGSAGEPAFINSWVNYDNGVATPGGGTMRDAAFRKDPLGKVSLYGVVRSGVSGTAIFTLPAGYRPAISDRTFSVSASTGLAQISVLASGNVVAANMGTSNVAGYVYLDGVEFDTDTVTALPTGPQGPPGAPGPSTPVQRVTSLPGNMYDGLEVYLVAAAGPPAVVWHMRFNGTSGKWEYIGGPPISYQAEGANAGYVGATNGTNITVDAGSATLLQWLFTPPLDCWIELTMNVGLMAKTDAAYHYAYLNLIASPVPAIGTVSSGPYQTQHSQVQQYMGYQFTKRFALTSGVAYQFYGQWAMSGGVWSYYQGPGTLWLTGKAWPR